MEDNKNKTKVDLMYDDLYEQGYLEKDRDTFNKFFYAPGEQGYKNRKALYDDLHEQGYLESPTYEDFAKGIGLHAVQQSQPVVQAGTGPAAGGRPDLVESLNQYGEGLKAQNTPQANEVANAAAPSSRGGGAGRSWSDGENVVRRPGNVAVPYTGIKKTDPVTGEQYRVYTGAAAANADTVPSELQGRDLLDENGNLISARQWQSKYGDKPHLAGAAGLWNGGDLEYGTVLDSHIQKAIDLGMKHGDHSRMSTDELKAKRKSILDRYANGFTETPESLQDAIDLNNIDYELTARHLGYKSSDDMMKNHRGEADFELNKGRLNQDDLDFYEKQGSHVHNLGDNPLYVYGWQKFTDLAKRNEELGQSMSVEDYINALMADPDIESKFYAWTLTRAKKNNRSWASNINEAMDDFRKAISRGENPWEYAPEEKDVMAKYATGELDRMDADVEKGLGAANERYEKWRKGGAFGLGDTDPYQQYMNATGDIDIELFSTAKNLNAQTRTLVDETMKGGGFMNSSIRGLVNGLFSKGTWDFGVGEMMDAGHMKVTIDKVLNNPNAKLTPGEQAMMDAVAAKIVFGSFFGKYLPSGYKAGETTAQSIPFIIEMATGIGETTQGLAKAAAKYTARQLSKYGTKFLERIGLKNVMETTLKALSKRGGRVLEKLTTSKAGRAITRAAESKVGRGVGTAIEKAVELGKGAVKSAVGGVGYAAIPGSIKTAGGAINRTIGTPVVTKNAKTGKLEVTGRMGAEEPFMAFMKEFGTQVGEYGSEMYGPYLEGLTGGLKSWGKALGIKAADKMGIGKLVREIGAGINESDMMRIINDFKKMGHYDGTFNEYLEEVANNVYNAAFIGDMNWGTGENGVFNKEDNIDTYLSCLYMSGLFGIPAAVSYRTPKYRAKQDVKRYGDMAKRIFGGHGNDWSTIANLIQDNSEEARKQLVVDLMQSGKYSKREKQIALQYAGAVYKSMGMDLGESKQKRSVGDQEAEDAYGRGYNMANLETIAETSSAYNQLRSQMERDYGAELMERMDDEPGLVYGWVRAGAVSEEDAQKVLNYLNAKMAYEGAVDRLNDDDAAAKAAAESHIDDQVHTEDNGGDGQIHPVTLKGRDGDHYVVSGNVVTDNNGKVDVDASDNEIVVVDSNGKRMMTTAKEIAQVGDTIDPDAAKAQAVAQISSVEAGVESGEDLDSEEGRVESTEGFEDTGLDSDEVAAPDGATQQDASSIQAPLPVTEYNQDDLVTVEVDGQQVTGIITNGLDNDGNVTIYFDEPINGRQNWQMTPGQLNQVAVSYTSRDGETISRGETPQEPQQPQPQQQQTPTAPAQVVSEEVSGEPSDEETIAQGTQSQVPTSGEYSVQSEEAAEPSGATQQAPAQPSLPVGEDGNADFSNATPQEAHDYIYNDPELDEDEANEVVRSYAAGAQTRLDEAQAALKQAEAVPAPKMEDYRSGNAPDVAGYKRAKRERNEAIAQAQAAVDAARREVDLWNGVQAQHMMDRATAAAANRAEERGQSVENPAAPSAPAPVSGESENNAPTPSQATPAQGQQTTESTQEPSAPQPNEENGPVASTTPSSSEEERGESAPVNETAGAAEEELTPDERIESARMEALENRAEELAESCGLPVQVARSLDDLSDRHRREVEKQHAAGKYVNGFYDPMTKQIVLFLPDIAKNGGMRRLERTFLHEGVAHGGLRALFENAQNGIQTFDDLCDQVWEMMPVATQASMMNYIGVQKPEDMTQEKKRIAADEYMAHLAEWGVEQSVKSRIISAVKNALRKIGVKMKLSNNDIVSLLAASRRKLNEMDKVRDSLENHGIATSDNGDALMFAVSDILEGDERKKAIKELMDVTGRSEATVKKWLKAEESLAKVILDNDNVELLDLQVDESVPSIWNNSDYPQGTVEFSNICRKRLPFTVIYQRLQEEFPNTVFDASTLEDIRNTMKENGVDVACGLCFVEDRRQLLGEIGEGFIKMVEGEEADLNENQQKALDKLRESGDNYVPNLYELLTLDGMKKLRKEHPAVAKAFVEFNNARGMQAGRLFQAYSAYHREILNWNKAKVKKVNDAGGLRIFSFSDFEAHHLIDLVQVLTDCAAKGVKVQGYTKVPEFAKAVKDTKMKLNRSLIAKGKGYVDADYVPKEGEAVSPNVIDGKRLLLDTVEGINVNHPDFFDSTDNNNVGNILVGINDEQIRLAMADSFVDYIIPFHSGLSEAIRVKKGIGDWVNYKLSQLEKKRNDKGKLVNADKHGVNIYTDVLPRGEELIGKPIRNARDFQNAFFKACEEKGWVPRFSKFINKNKKGQYVYTPGYEKLLLDFKLFDKNGKLLPQEAVVPLFDNEFNKKILDDYVKGEKAKTPYDDLYEKIKERLGLPNGTVIKSQEADDGGVMFSTSPTFYSNAERAVENIKQNKATAEQWKAMLTKAGGLKSGEDKWMGLSQWLEDNKGKSLTKEEVQQFIADNGIEMEEVKYGEGLDPIAIYNRYGLGDYNFDGEPLNWTEWFKIYYGGIEFQGSLDDKMQLAEIVNNQDHFVNPEDYHLDQDSGKRNFVKAVEAELFKFIQKENEGKQQLIDGTRLDYTTEGLENKREIAFVVPNVEPYQEHDEVHFGPENQGKAVMWVRFGETTDADGKRVLVIDEIQSNRHQDAREKGYSSSEETKAKAEEAKKEMEDFIKQMQKKYKTQYWGTKCTHEENVRYHQLSNRYEWILNSGVPAAPFEKNWHEVAMKRMLRLAAEEGFDKVAWTTGEQQAKRYNLGRMYDSIEREDNPSIDGKRFVLSGRNMDTFVVNKEGNIEDSSFSEFNGKPLSDVVGKDLAERMMNLEDGDMLEGEDLRIGGEGMKGFYDQMLPRFMDKYGKRWGVKTGTVELPNVEEAGRTMHSVDVTPEMKESVMQGQPLFSVSNYSLGVPYQGTKGRIARSLMEKLPSGRRFVDLFAGGGAMTHAAMLSGKYDEYLMNDVNPVGVELFMQGVRGEWDDYNRTSMTPEEFKQIKGTPEAIPWSVLGLGRNLVKGGRPDYINRVKRLGQLKDQADKVSNSFEDYRNVEIRPGDVVYADIPYENTDTYNYGKGRRFDKKAFCDWAQAQDFPVFVSESVMPEGWVEIASESMKTINPKKNRVEKLWVQEKFAGEYEPAARNTEQEPEVDGGLRFSVREKPEPKKTIPVYKLMRLGDDGKLYPLFIDGTEPIELGVWYDADSPNMDMLVDLPIGVHLIDTDNGTSMTMEEYVKQNNIKLKKGQKYPPKEVIESTPNGQRWVYIEPTERGQRRFGGESRRYWNLGINGSGSVSTFSMRPGWHAGSLPTMRQIGKGAKKNLRDDRFVWVEGLISADIDYNEEAQGNPDNDIPTHIPTDGFYMKATNANAKASQADRVGWYISGAFMPVKIMSDSEARQVIDEWNADPKHADLQVEYDFPRESGKVFNAETMQLEDEAETRFSTSAAVAALKDDERVYNDLLGKVFSGVSNETRRGIVEDAMRNRGNDFGAATEAWLGGLADDGKFADVDRRDWGRVKLALHQALMDNGVDVSEPLSDGESRYVLWKAGQVDDGVFSMAEDVVMRDRLLSGAHAPQYTDNADVRFSTSPADQVYSDNFKNWFGDWENDSENASKVVDEDGRPLVVDGCYVVSDNDFVKKYDKLIDKAKRYVERIREAESKTGATYPNVDFFYTTEGARINEDLFRENESINQLVDGIIRGNEPKIRISFRYGKVRENGKSWNYRDNRYEDGVSTVGRVADLNTKRSSYYETYFGDEPYYIIAGIDVGNKGADGETLLSAPVVLGKAEDAGSIVKSATDNNGEFSRENPDIRFSVNGIEPDYVVDKEVNLNARNYEHELAKDRLLNGAHAPQYTDNADVRFSTSAYDVIKAAREAASGEPQGNGYISSTYYHGEIAEGSNAGEKYTIRISDHPAKWDNFVYSEDEELDGRVLSIVITDDLEYINEWKGRGLDEITDRDGYDVEQYILNADDVDTDMLTAAIENFKKTGRSYGMKDGEMIGIQESGDGIQFSVTPRDRAIARGQYERWMKSGRMQWLESMQDSMLGLKKLMQAIMGDEYGYIEDIPMYENPYIAENLMSSVTAAQQQAFYTEFMKPLLKEVSKLCKGGKKAREKAREELTNYLMAKHGLERNQVLADRDAQETAQAGGNYQDAYAENRERDYSGLTALTGEDDVHAAEAKAQQMVDDYESQHDTTELWQKINAATQVTLEKQYKSGMLSYAEYQRISGMFEYYVPLRGWEETTSDEVYGYLTSKAGPFLGGSIVKPANGRTTVADDPIANIAQMGDDSIRTGNRNLMKQTFLNFVQNHPSDAVSVSDLWLQYDAVTDEWVPAFAKIDPKDSADVVLQKIDAFEQQMQQLASQEPTKYKHGREAANIPYRVIPGMEKEHQVLVKRNGQTWVMTINGNPRAAQALNGLTNPDVQMKGAWASMIKGAEWVNRTLSTLYTTLSPAFIVSNFLRDAGYSNTMVWVRESPNYALRFNKNYLKLNPGTLRWLLGKWEEGTLDESKPLQKHFKEFMLNGGETGFAMVKDLDKYKKDLLNEVKNMNSRNFVRKGMKVLGSQYELLGRSIENCARFAAYMTSREMGRDVKRSAYDAKEISVNFNKKGSGGKSLGKVGQTMSGNVGALISGMARSLYTFWNAGVQGMTNAGRAVKRHPVKAALMGAGPLYAAGFLAPILAQMMGAGGDGDDDKNAYYNLPEYVRRSNLCIWLGDAWLTIPLPIEFRSIYGLGELTYGVISGNERYSDEELAMQVAGQFSQLLPIDMLEGGGGFHPFIPTLFKPLVEAEQNKSWSGLPIYRKSEWNKDDPEYTKAFSNANEWIVSGAEWLNAKTGGDEFKKGWIDLNPAKIEYMLKGYLGGIYTTIDEVRRAAETAFGKRDFEWRNMPLANRVIKQGDERTESKKLRDEYFKYKEDYENTKHLINKYKNAENTDLFDYAKKLDLLNNSKEYGRYLIFEKYATMLEAYQKAKKGASGEVLKKIEEDEKALMRQLVDEMHAFEDGKITVGNRPKLSKKDRSEEYGYMYNKLRTYVDINEDALLDSALKRAKATDDKGLVSALNSTKRSISEMKKGLGRGKDEEVMNSIREMRNSVLRSFGIIGGEEEAPESEEQRQEEPQEDWGDEGNADFDEPIEPYPDDEDDEYDY